MNSHTKLESGRCFWQRNSGRLVSLWEFMEAFHPILSAAPFAAMSRAEHEAALRFWFQVVADDVKRDLTLFVLEPATVLCREAGLSESLNMLGRVQGRFSRKMRYGEMKTALEELRGVILSEFARCNLFIAPTDRLSFYNNDRIFGDEVFRAFPSARMDIREAGNCWLFGRNNAVVYHLMEAAEFGLRALANDRRVEIKGGKVPLDRAQWGQVLSELSGKVSEIKDWPVRSEKNDAMQFYNDALISVRAFNDGYRTHISHARGRTYQDDETFALQGHVKRFMQKLASRISDTEVTPEIWL